MSNSYKNGAFALGLIVGGGLALNLFLWLDYRTNNEISANSGTGQDAQNSQIGQYWDGLIGTFISPSDTLAQWVMALFTICATIVLIFTLRSANKTNVAAISASEAALEANKIMRDERRPWVTLIKDIDCMARDFGHGIEFTWHFDFQNRGKTPAFDVKTDIMAFKQDHLQNLDAISKEFSLKVRKKHRLKGIPVIFPDDTADLVRHEDSSSYRYKNADTLPKVHDDWRVFLIVCLSYRLSFDSSEFGVETHALTFDGLNGNEMAPAKLLEFTYGRHIE